MEMANTRKVLERIPDDRLDWQPHPKSHTIGWNANHVADLLKLALCRSLKTPSLGHCPGWRTAPIYLPQLATRQEILELFDRDALGLAQSHQRGQRTRPVGSAWTLLRAGTPIFTHALCSRDPGICP